MIRRLDQHDRHAALTLLRSNRSYNLYALGNINTLGFEQSHCTFWGDFSSDQSLRGILNRYIDGWQVFGVSQCDWRGLAGVLDCYPSDAKKLQDNPGGITSFLPFLQTYRSIDVSEQTMMRLAPGSLRPQAPGSAVRVRRATAADFAALVEFYATAEHMSRTAMGVAEPLQQRRIWLGISATTFSTSEIVSAALTNAEAEGMAMIGGVYTKPAWRGCGYAKSVVGALCEDLQSHDLQPVLYWQTPAAGHVYRQLGFHPIGTWRSVRLERKGTRKADPSHP